MPEIVPEALLDEPGPPPEPRLGSGMRGVNLPPQSVEAEQALLGGLMVDNQAWDLAADVVTEGDFYRQDHRTIFRAMYNLVNANSPIDVLTLQDALTAVNELEQAGGMTYLVDLAQNTPSAANVRSYAEIVRERSILRHLISATNDIQKDAFQPAGRKSRDILDEAEQRIFRIAEQGATRTGPRNVNELLKNSADRLHELMKSSSPLTGMATGFSDLDNMTCGLQPGDLIIIAGRPSMGKTSFAMNIVENAVINGEKPVLAFSMEMPAESLIMRMISSLGRIDQSKVRRGDLNEEDWNRVVMAVNMLEGKPLFIDDTPGLSPMEMRTAARRVAREHGTPGLIMVDYLQLMQVPGNSENRATEISEISRSLKALANELKVPIIALSQLNRSLEQRPNKRPVMSDLRESGAIEQDADLIMFIYRDEVYNKDDESVKGQAEIIIGKQRNGPIGTVDLVFLDKFTRFEDREHNSYSEYQ